MKSGELWSGAPLQVPRSSYCVREGTHSLLQHGSFLGTGGGNATCYITCHPGEDRAFPCTLCSVNNDLPPPVPSVNRNTALNFLEAMATMETGLLSSQLNPFPGSTLSWSRGLISLIERTVWHPVSALLSETAILTPLDRLFLLEGKGSSPGQGMGAKEISLYGVPSLEISLWLQEYSWAGAIVQY